MNQPLKAFRNQFVQLDALRDKRFQVDFARFYQLDGFGMVVAVGDGAAHVQFFHHHAVHVDGGGFAPNRHNHHFARWLHGGNQSIQHFVYAGAFKRHVHAFTIGEFHHFGDHVHFAGVKNVVCHARFACFFFARFAQFGDDDFKPFGFQNGG